MLIGILSDTHDRLEAATAGIAALRARGAERFIHCGDVGGERILDLLAGIGATFVWGNTDYRQAELTKYAADLGIDCRGHFGELEIDGKKIAVTHGHDEKLIGRLVIGEQYDYLLHGHTHIKRDERVGRTRIINPGALHRAAVKTVALLDPRRDALDHLVIQI
jgi:putative phosphoesterase